MSRKSSVADTVSTITRSFSSYNTVPIPKVIVHKLEIVTNEFRRVDYSIEYVSQGIFGLMIIFKNSTVDVERILHDEIIQFGDEVIGIRHGISFDLFISESEMISVCK